MLSWQYFSVVCPGRNVADIYVKEPEDLDHLHFGIFDTDWEIYTTLPPKVNSSFFFFAGNE